MANALQEMVARNFNRAVPMSALFELTFVCNHACTFCYNCPTGQREMNTEEVFDALQKLADFNILYLTLSGGEPLCRRDFFAIAARARELGFAIRIYTNAFLIDEAMARKIKEIASPIEMEISIHGARPETHEKLTCVPGSFRKVVDAVRHLRAQGIKINLKCPITRDNQEDVLDLHRLAVDLGATIIFDPVVTPRDDGDKEPLSLMASDEFLQKFWTSPEYAGARKEPVPKPRHEEAGEAVCGTGRSSLAIDPYGNIYPCVQWRRSAGNIRQLKSIKEIWQSSPVLIEVRQAAVDMAAKLREMHRSGGSGGFCNFCLGVADLQTGDPMSYYPQAAKNAEFRLRAYQAWKEKTGEAAEDTGGVLTKCLM